MMMDRPVLANSQFVSIHRVNDGVLGQFCPRPTGQRCDILRFQTPTISFCEDGAAMKDENRCLPYEK